MQKILSISAICFLLLMGCKRDKTVYKEVQSTNGIFTIEVPENMNPTNELMPHIAVLQYANDSTPLYIIAMDTSRNGLNEKNLDAFYDSTVSEPNIDGATMDKRGFSMVDGDSAYTTTLRGSHEGQKLIYKVEVLATPTHFIYLQAWTKGDKKEDLEPIMDKMLKSFHDVNHKKV